MKTNRLKKLLCIMAVLVILVMSTSVFASATGEATWSGDSVSQTYSYYSRFTAPTKYCTFNGTNYPAKAMLTFPSGKMSTFGDVLLDEIGQYSVVYTSNVEGTTYTSATSTFDVKASPADLWNTNVMIKTSNSANVPDLDGNGAVLLSAHDRAEARFINPVYLGDNRSIDDLMTFVVSPINHDQAEFESFYIVVEDYFNPENRLYIRLSRGVADVESEKHNMNITVSTDGITYLGKDGKQYDFKKNSRATSYILKGSGFYGKNEDGTSIDPVKVGIDIRKKKVTLSCENTLSFDLTDEFIVGKGKEWKGLESGLAYVYAGFMERLTSAPSGVAIYSVDGISMSGTEFTSIKDPTVVVDDSVYEVNPIAKKGVKHSFLDAVAIDPILGNLDTSISVYKVKDDVLESIPCSYDGFVPDSVGTYYVEYLSETNAFGKNGVGGYYLEVKDGADCDITFEFGDLVDSVKAGQAIIMPDYEVSGGIGKKTVTYSAKIGNKPVEIVGGRVIPENAGTLVLTATCKDLIQTVEFSENIVVNENDEVYFDFGYIPSAIMLGDSLDLSNGSAYKYAGNGKEYLDATITFAGATITDGKIIPTSSQVGDKELVISAGGVVKNYTITIKDPGNETGMIKNYFSISSGELVPGTSNTQAVTSEDSTIEFLREVDKDFFNIRFVARPTDAKFTHLKFTLYDTLNADNYVTFNVLNSKNASLGEYSELEYDGETYEVYGNFRDPYGSIIFIIKYDAKTNSIVDKNNPVLTLTKRADGSEFNGFEGNIRFTIEMCGVSEESKLNIYEVGAQAIKKSVTNEKSNSGPQLVYKESFLPGVTGEEYVLPKFNAFDVLNNVASVTMVVEDSEGNEVFRSSDISAFKFTPVTSGEHNITLTLLDDKGNDKETTTKINVSLAGGNDFVIGGVNVPTGETVAPVITIQTKPTTISTVGSVINIAKITITDDKTSQDKLSIHAYVIAPDGVRTLLCSTPSKTSTGDDLTADAKYAMLTSADAQYLSFTASRTGKYIVYYVVRDSHNLTTIARYSVEVK